MLNVKMSNPTCTRNITRHEVSRQLTTDGTCWNNKYHYVVSKLKASETSEGGYKDET